MPSVHELPPTLQEFIKGRQSTCGSDSENRPGCIRTAFFRGAVEVAVRTFNQNPGDRAVRAARSALAAKSVERGTGAGRGYLENSAGATGYRTDGTSGQCCAIEIAVERLHQAGGREGAVGAVGTALTAERIDN